MVSVIKNWIKTKLILLAKKVLDRYEFQRLTIPPEALEILNVCRPLCASIDSFSETGEWKRHQIYANLLKSFPNADKRDIALAIELAVRSIGR